MKHNRSKQQVIPKQQEVEEPSKEELREILKDGITKEEFDALMVTLGDIRRRRQKSLERVSIYCARCHQLQPATMFTEHSKKVCKDCRKLLNKVYYMTHTEEHKEKVKEYKAKRRAMPPKEPDELMEAIKKAAKKFYPTT